MCLLVSPFKAMSSLLYISPVTSVCPFTFSSSDIFFLPRLESVVFSCLTVIVCELKKLES